MPTINRPFHKRVTARGSKPSDLTRDVAHDYRRTVGAWIQHHRSDKDLTQKELGDLIGVGPTAISAIELGRGSIPPERYEVLATVLGIPLETFGMTMLRYTNPWCYAMIFGKDDKKLRDDLETIPTRGGSPLPP